MRARKRQVVLAIDDSRSMAENGCGAFALEALLYCDGEGRAAEPGQRRADETAVKRQRTTADADSRTWQAWALEF